MNSTFEFLFAGVTICIFYLLIFAFTFKAFRALIPTSRLVSQALAPTSVDPHTSTDESNTLANTGAASQIRENLQQQAAPELSQRIELLKATTTQLYSTNMYLGQFSFTTTNVTGDVLASFSVGQIMQLPAIQRLFRDKRYARFDLRISMNMTGSPFGTGLNVLGVLPQNAHLPTGADVQDTSLRPTYSNILNRLLATNHVEIDISQDGVYSIDIPWTHYNSWASVFDYTTAVNFATVYVAALTPYVPPTGQTTNVNFELYADIINLETFETTSLVSQALFQFGGQNNQNTITHMSDINDSNLPLNVTGDHLDTKVDTAVGLDQPSNPTQAPSMLRDVYQKLLSWRNVTNVFKWSSTPKDMVEWTPPMAKEMRVEMDEMSIDFFRQRYVPTTSAGSFPITTSMSTGTLLYQKTIDSMPEIVGNYGNNFAVTAAGNYLIWLNSLFNYCRGSMDFRFLFATNKFIRGKVLIGINYGDITPLTNIGSGNLDPRSIPHLIVDLSNTDKRVDVMVPYKSINEYLRVRSPCAGTTQQTDTDYTIGRVGIWLISPLQVNAASASTVNVFPMMALGQDFDYFMEAPTPRIGYVSQARLTPREMESSAFVRQFMMTSFVNLKELLSKPQLIGSFTIDSSSQLSPTSAKQPLLIPMHPTLWSNNPLWGAMTAMYGGLRGGYRAVVRCTNIVSGVSIRIQYFPYIVPRNGSGGVVPPYAASMAQFDLSEVSGVSDHLLYPAHGALPAVKQLAVPGIVQLPIPLNTTATGAQYYLAAYGNPSFQTVILDSYSQPEVIIEIPDPSPLYRSQESTAIPWGYNLSGSGKYNPFADRNMGYLAISATDNFPQDDNSYNVEVSVMAADDFRAFWYNGGPTRLTPYAAQFYANGATPTYYNAWTS